MDVRMCVININIHINMISIGITRTFDTLNWAWHCLKYNLIISWCCETDASIHLTYDVCVLEIVCVSIFDQFLAHTICASFTSRRPTWSEQINHFIDWSSPEVFRMYFGCVWKSIWFMILPHFVYTLHLISDWQSRPFVDQFAQFNGKSMCGNPGKFNICKFSNWYVTDTPILYFRWFRLIFQIAHEIGKNAILHNAK